MFAMPSALPAAVHAIQTQAPRRAKRSKSVIALPRAAVPMPIWHGSVLGYAHALFFVATWHAKLTLQLVRSAIVVELLRLAPDSLEDLLGPWVLEAAGAWTFTNGGRSSLIDGTFDINSDVWRMALFLSTSNIGAASTTYAGLTNEHANANGYTTGGVLLTLSMTGTTTVTVDSTDAVWTATGGSIVARFAVIYEVAGNVLCYCLLESVGPADVTATDTNTLTVSIHASGVFTLA